MIRLLNLPTLLTLLVLSLNLTACAQTPSQEKTPKNPLIGEWSLAVLNTDELAKLNNVTLRFMPNGDQVTGYAGCNRYFGRLVLKGDKIQFGPLASTRKFCPNSSLESRFLQRLESTTHFVQQGEMLSLLTDKQVVLTFVQLHSAKDPTNASIPKTIQGTVTYQPNQYLLGNHFLTVRLLDTSLQDVKAKLISEYHQPITGQKPFHYHLSLDPKALKPGHRYSLFAKITEAKTGKLKWITTQNYNYLPDSDKAQNLKLRVDPANQLLKRQTQKTSFVCQDDGQNNQLKMEVLGKFIKLQYQGKQWMLTRVPSGSGEKYQNQQLMFWIKSPEAILTFTAQENIHCQQQ